MTKPLFLLLVCLFLFHKGIAQSPEFAKADEQALSVSLKAATDVSTLAQKLTKGLTSDRQKARAIYVWITNNIKYDLRLISENNSLPIEQKKKRQQPDRILKSGKAVCEGYANLFTALCDAAGLTSEYIGGYTKDSDGKVVPITHAWNAVELEGTWWLVDATWGAGGFEEGGRKFIQSMSEQYFLATPADFNYDHFPVDPVFQLVANPLTFKEFEEMDKNGFAVYMSQNKMEGPYAAFGDTLQFYHTLDSLGKLTNSCLRTLRSEPDNGYAAYLLTSHYYNSALDEYNAFSIEAEKITRQPKKMTLEQVERWEKQVASAKIKTEHSLALLKPVTKQDPLYPYCENSIRNMEAAYKSIVTAEKSLPEWRAYVERK